MMAFERNMLSVLRAIDSCLEQKMILPALMLIYGAIDIVSSLEAPLDAGVRDRFTKWVDTYLLKAKPLSCSALDLYAARCSMLHSLTPDSTLSRQAKARPIIYAWGTANSEKLQAVSDAVNTNDYVAIHVSDLNQAFRLGLAAFYEEVERDPARGTAMNRSLARWFDPLSTEHVDTFLDFTGPAKP
jgi:hypothetical protein